ncbi:MAG TPA: nuclear transport factor 2 family protein [Geminicoccaceae bacterium]|nr:nuclear transport factor 2 family protein [Geminicoccus sp.]HMU52153.1 nuclear transport factor 2 family protein [Geminicoccaceae bacterium]
MDELNRLVDRYIAAWNEPDPARRHQLVAETYVEEASYVDPLAQAEGHAAIEAMIQAVQAQFPDHLFRRRGGVDGHNGRVRFAWELAGPDGETKVAGIDFGMVAADGRFQALTGFIDGAPPGRLAA